MIKNCPKCKIDKNEIEFSKDKYRRNGLDTYCKECKRIVTSEGLYKLRNTEDGFLKHKVICLYTPSAIKERGFVPECSKEEIIESYYNYTKKYGKICFYCKDTFTFILNKYTPNIGNNRHGKGTSRKNKLKNLSFDRLDSSKTYFIDNIIFCCTECNLSKKDISIKLIKRLHEIIIERNL
jgi:hypothetical protein